MAGHGAVVSDSDATAKALLDAPSVRATLLQWWGGRSASGMDLLGADGRINRAAVAAIIFADPAQRTRLESLIHPLIGQRRAAELAEAAARGAPMFVIDAPLLLEAGLDRECQEVIYVDTPRAQRLARVSQTRGWTEAELDRREKAQWPLEAKRAKATRVIVNDGDDAALGQRVASVVHQMLEHARHNAGPA
ncbi:MAG: dephospho-CoA kinase [Phycisphaerales bacterium]|nr:dephospho-CoA kinase [Phycisphaerales bacterium]